MKKNKRIIMSIGVGLSTLTIGASTIAGCLIAKNNKFSNPAISNYLSSIDTYNTSSLGITPKETPTIDSYDKLYASQIYEQFKPIINSIENKQNEAWELLSKFFDNIDEKDKTFKIKNLRVNAFSSSGSLNIYFGLYNERESLMDQINGVWTLPTKGTTTLISPFYQDNTKTSDQILNILKGNDQNAKNLIMKNLIGAIGQNTTYSWDSIEKKPLTKEIVIKNITIKNAIGEKGIIGSKQISGEFYIVGKDYSPAENKQTTIVPNNQYISDSLFATVANAQQFKDLLESNKNNNNYISKLITINNAPQDANVSIKTIHVSDNSATIEFSINKYYDEFGNLIENEKTITYKYNVFPIQNSKATVVSANNPISLDGLEYAYEYTVDKLKEIINNDISATDHKIVLNPWPGSTATDIKILEINNKTGMIKTNVTLSAAYNDYGTQDGTGTKQFSDIYFKVPNVIKEPTSIQRNGTPINPDDNINKFDKEIEAANKDSEKLKNIVSKYIEIVGYTSDAPKKTDYKVNSINKVSTYTTSQGIEKAALYEVDASLLNYVKNDDLFSYVDSDEEEHFKVYINVFMNKPTQLIPSVASDGIDANTGNDSLMKITAADFAARKHDDTLKSWIATNFNAIFENYSFTVNKPGDVLNDISIKNVVESSNTSIQITVGLKNTLTFEGVVKDDKDFTFTIKNLIKPINTLLKKEIQFNTNESTIYASEKIKDGGEIKKIVTTEILKSSSEDLEANLINTEYFENIPSNSLDTTSKFIEIVPNSLVANNNTGEISLSIKLPAFYTKGILYELGHDGYDSNVIEYPVIISGFKKISPSFEQMDKTIDANGSQINESVNNKQLISAYDYKTPIKNNINAYLNKDAINHYAPETIQKMKDYMNSGFDIDTKWELKVSKANSKLLQDIQATVIVKNNKFAELSDDSTWSHGITFTISNAKYAVTDISNSITSDLSMTYNEFQIKLAQGEIALSMFGFNMNYAPKINYDDNDNYNQYASTLKIGVVQGDNITGKAQLKIVIPEIYDSQSLNIIKNYDYVFNFNFKPLVPPQDIDYLKDSIDANNLTIPNLSDKLSSMNVIDATNFFNNPENEKTINDWLSNKTIADQIYQPSIKFREPIKFVNANANSDGTMTIVVSIGDPAIKNEAIKITNLTPFKTTDPRIATTSIPSGLTIDNVKSYDFKTNASKFITFNAGKTPNGQIIAIEKVEVEQIYNNNNEDGKQIAYVNFTFNGIYTEDNNINSFKANYTIKVKLTFADPSTLPANQTKMEIVDKIDNNSKKQIWNWFILFIIILSIVVGITLLSIFIDRQRKKSKR